MVVIFFNLGLVLAFILLVSIVFINASTKFVLAILGVICILFLTVTHSHPFSPSLSFFIFIINYFLRLAR